MSKKILFIVSSAGQIGPNNRKTGNYLPEVSHPYHVFSQKGYTIDFASTQGANPPLDGVEVEDVYNKEFLEGQGLKSINSAKKITEINIDDYDALFVPGGLGPMVDMPENTDIQKVIARMYEKGGVVSAVCHGPASLVNVKLSDGSYLINGKKLTSFSNAEEEGYAKNDVPFLLESSLKERGANHFSVANWEANTIVDGRLVTGQNPASAIGTAEAVVKLLEAK